MNAKGLHTIFDDYNTMSVDSLIDFKNLIDDYPYCQSAQILYLLNLKYLQEDTFDIRLPYTAIYVNDRERLRQEVEKVESLLQKDELKVLPKAKKSLKEETNRQPKIKTLVFRSLSGKTISELLDLKTTETEHKEVSHKPAVSEKESSQATDFRPKKAAKTSVKLPQTVHADDEYLELMRQEALAKINQRLEDVKKIPLVEVDFTERSTSRIVSAKNIIDKVIETNPKISKVNTESKGTEFKEWKKKEEMSLREDYELVSETLAQLYLSQGATQKAIAIYKNLSEKFPDKKAYFNKIIKKIKK